MSTTAIDWSAQDVKDTEPIVADGKPTPASRFPGFPKGAPARKGTAPKAGRQSKPKVTEPPSKPGEFVEDITAFYAAIGIGVGMRDHECGKVIVANASKIAEQWDKVAESNAAVRKALRSLTKATMLGALVAVHMPIVMAIASHHGPGFGPNIDTTDLPEDDNGA